MAALQRHGGLGERDGVHGAAVAGDVAGTQAQLVGELHQRVLDGGVALFGLHTGELGGVRGRCAAACSWGSASRNSFRRRSTLGLSGMLCAAASKASAGLVGGGAGLDDRLVVLALALEQGRRGDVALVEEGVAVDQGGLHEARGLLRVLGLLPGVDRALHLEAAHDEADHHGYEQDRVQPGRHAPVARGETAAARSGWRHRLRAGHRGGRRSARRRGEVAPRRRLGTVLASPHSTNNLSADGTNVVPQSLRAGKSKTLHRGTSLTIRQFRHSSTSAGRSSKRRNAKIHSDVSPR